MNIAGELESEIIFLGSTDEGTNVSGCDELLSLRPGPGVIFWRHVKSWNSREDQLYDSLP